MSKTNFVISTRKVENSQFKPEPGPTRYMIVCDEQEPHPKKHTRKKDKWLKRLIERATICEITEGRFKGYSYGNTLIFVHGYNNSPTDVMKRHNRLQKLLFKQGFKGAIISYDWPSDNSAFNYDDDKADAEKTARSLVDDGIKILAMNQMRKNKCILNVHLLGHSMGAYVIREAFYRARKMNKASRAMVNQIVFISADIPQESLSTGSQKSNAMFCHSERITNYQNIHDGILWLSKMNDLEKKPVLGRSGAPRDAHENVINVNAGEHWEKLKGDYFDVDGDWSHSWYFQKKDEIFAKDLVHTLAGRTNIPTRKMEDGEWLLVDPADPKVEEQDIGQEWN